MARRFRVDANLNYLNNKPVKIWWNVIAGPPGYKLSILQEGDLVFDKKDCQMRQLDYNKVFI